MIALVAAPELLERLQAHETRILIVPEPAGILVDDVLEPGTARLDLQELVDLLLVLHDGEARLGMIDDELHLLLDGVLVQGDGHAAERLGGQHRPVELGPVVADDRRLVSAAEPERRQAQRDQPRLLEVLPPGVRLPDPILLLADGDLVGKPFDVATDQFGERILRGVQTPTPVRRGPAVWLGHQLFATLPMTVRPGSMWSLRISISRALGGASRSTCAATRGLTLSSATTSSALR